MSDTSMPPKFFYCIVLTEQVEKYVIHHFQDVSNILDDGVFLINEEVTPGVLDAIYETRELMFSTFVLLVPTFDPMNVTEFEAFLNGAYKIQNLDKFVLSMFTFAANVKDDTKEGVPNDAFSSMVARSAPKHLH